MKLGNISQTILPVPKFFTDKEVRTIEIFKITDNNKSKVHNKRKSNYYRQSDLIMSNKDININLNPRTFSNDKDNYDEKRYIPIYDRAYLENNAEKKKTDFPNIINTFRVKKLDRPNNKNEYKNVYKYLQSTNLNHFLKKDLRQEIMDNTKRLIDRINTTYDLNKWNEFNSRTTMNKEFQTAYSPITDAIKEETDYKDEFMKTLYKKSLSLKTITEKSKNLIKKNFKSYDAKNRFRRKWIFNNDNSLSKNKSDLDKLLETNKSNLLNLKINNSEPIEYLKEEKDFLEKNKSVTNSINKYHLYKYFPSMTRMEFELRKIYPKKKKNTLIDEWGVIDINKYKSKKENFSCLNSMWKRPFHSDAYKIV